MPSKPNRHPSLIDRRQEIAAALILVAFDLPADSRESAVQLKRAATAAPGITMAEIKLGDRIETLRRARAILDELLENTEP